MILRFCICLMNGRQAKNISEMIRGQGHVMRQGQNQLRVKLDKF